MGGALSCPSGACWLASNAYKGNAAKLGGAVYAGLGASLMVGPGAGQVAHRAAACSLARTQRRRALAHALALIAVSGPACVCPAAGPALR